MIRRLKKQDIEDIALTHLLSWQLGFKNILSDSLLQGLTKDEFLNIWLHIIKNKKRSNFVALSDKKPIAFVSFGPSQESINVAEVYGIYVNPNFWRQGHGNLLMKKALTEISNDSYSSVILWVMTKNNSARQFYEKNGFKKSLETRISKRKDESFEECKYQLDII